MSRPRVLKGSILAASLAAVAATVAIAGAVSAREDKPAAAKPDKPGPACLDASHTGRFHVVDDHTLLVYDRWQNAYKLDIGGPCRSMTDLSHFGFEFYGSSQVCRPHDAKLLYSEDREAPVSCLINGVTPLTKAQADVLDPG